jgi:hypothetical protein
MPNLFSSMNKSGGRQRLVDVDRNALVIPPLYLSLRDSSPSRSLSRGRSGGSVIFHHSGTTSFGSTTSRRSLTPPSTARRSKTPPPTPAPAHLHPIRGPSCDFQVTLEQIVFCHQRKLVWSWASQSRGMNHSEKRSLAERELEWRVSTAQQSNSDVGFFFSCRHRNRNRTRHSFPSFQTPVCSCCCLTRRPRNSTVSVFLFSSFAFRISRGSLFSSSFIWQTKWYSSKSISFSCLCHAKSNENCRFRLCQSEVASPPPADIAKMAMIRL